MPVADRIIQLCLFLDSNPAYQQTKVFFRDLLENSRAPQKRYFDLFMIALVLSSVMMLVYDVGHPVTPAAALFEDVAVSIFILEYLLRFWVHDDPHRIFIDHYDRADFLEIPFRIGPAFAEIARNKWAYVSSPLAIIDLLAILPSYRPIRLLRIFLLFRLFKLFRYTRSASGMASILAEKRFELYTLALFLVFVLLTSSTAIYLFEGDAADGQFGSFFEAVYWSMITLSTVGYGDITPHTTEGRVVAIALVVSGIGVVAFTTSVVVAAFQEKLTTMRERRVFTELERMRDYTVVCGYGRVGQVVVDRLASEKQPFIIIDNDSDSVREAASNGYLAIQGNAAQDELLRNVGIEKRASKVLCVTGDDVTNIYVTISARQMNRHLTIISRANRKQMVHKLKLAGADHVVAPFEIVGLMGSEYVGKPVAFEAIYGILSGDRDVVLEAVSIPVGCTACHCPLGDLDLAGHKLLLFGVITSQEKGSLSGGSLYPLSERHFYFNPSADLVLEDRDILVLMGHQFSLQHFRRTLKG